MPVSADRVDQSGREPSERFTAIRMQQAEKATMSRAHRSSPVGDAIGLSAGVR